MSFDGLVMAAVKEELIEKVVGGRVEKIYQPVAREIVLLIHKDKNKYRLLVSADATDARVHLTQTARENPLTPPLFCMVLRKHLEGGRITKITQTGLERVLTIGVDAVDELGMLSAKNLVCEVMGKHSNIILVDPASDVILDGINRFSYATSRHREILPGRVYSPPPESGKMNPLEVTEEAFRSALWDPDQDVPIEKLILNSFEGFGPQTCREVTVRAGIDPGISNQFLGELELQRLWETFRTIRNCVASGMFKPSLCYKGSIPAAFSAVELSQFSETVCKAGQISETLDEFFSTRGKQQRLKLAVLELTKVVRHAFKKCQNKHSIHQETLRKAQDTERLKITGELITANIYQIPKRVGSVELENYYDPDGGKIVVELDPRMSPAENAQSYFKKYTKARSSQAIAEIYLKETKAELTYLESVMVSLEQADEISELAEIKAELIKEGYIKPEAPAKGVKKTLPAVEPEPMRFKSKDGLDILVGRNNRQNDYLTQKMARPEDLWLHVKDIPGSHVIVKNPGGTETPKQSLQQAAEIAAYYSKARESSKVPVDYTLRKWVRKPKGAKPGTVIYENQRTIIVEPKGLS